MAKPLLMVNATVFIKAGKKKAKKKVVKTKVKKPEVPMRPSPFKVGDAVWVNEGNEYRLREIGKKVQPRKSYGEIGWKYVMKTTANSGSFDNVEWEECNLYPVVIFTLIATDAIRMMVAPFEDSLNKVFDAKVKILAVFRDKQKKPWAYYVIFDEGAIFEDKKHKWINGSYPVDSATRVHKVPAAAVTMRLLPISSAPQEILTYLGLYVYSRKWIRHGSD